MSSLRDYCHIENCCYFVSKLDILKMDIEGLEDEVFSSDPEKWLPLVDMIIVEIHSPKKLEVIRKILGHYHFTMTRYRSVWYCINRAYGRKDSAEKALAAPQQSWPHR
ncbi:MAG: FkbM family methyltransferase [Gammaproteobacteria bacterium]